MLAPRITWKLSEVGILCSDKFIWQDGQEHTNAHISWNHVLYKHRGIAIEPKKGVSTRTNSTTRFSAKQQVETSLDRYWSWNWHWKTLTSCNSQTATGWRHKGTKSLGLRTRRDFLERKSLIRETGKPQNQVERGENYQQTHEGKNSNVG